MPVNWGHIEIKRVAVKDKGAAKRGGLEKDSNKLAGADNFEVTESAKVLRRVIFDNDKEVARAKNVTTFLKSFEVLVERKRITEHYR